MRKFVRLVQERNVQRLRCELPMQAWSDSWALVHWILVDIFEDAEKWMEAAMSRDEPTTVQGYGINVCNHTLNRRFVRLLKQASVNTTEDWVKFVHNVGIIEGAWQINDNYIINNFQQTQLLLPPYIRGSKDSFITGLFPWAQFLRQSKFQAYYDNVEGIGICAGVAIDQGERLEEVSGNLFFVGHYVASVPYPKGMRWSFFENSYMSGPASLINCSCSKHRNVNMRPSRQVHAESCMEVISEWYIAPGEKLYSAYSENICDMMSSRGIRCPMCAK